MSAGAPRRLMVLGLRCPVPVLMAGRALAEVGPGERLEVVGDDPEMLRDFPAFCDEAGHRLLSISGTDGTIRCLIEKGPHI